MTTDVRNAAIFFTAKDYNPNIGGINGRRMVSSSFLRGFFEHADVDEFISATRSQSLAEEFNRTAHSLGVQKPLKNLYSLKAEVLRLAGTLFYNSGGFGDQVWRRYRIGTAAYSICGVTHTLSTPNVMRSTFDMRAGPQKEWDGIICTSSTAKSVLTRQMDAVDHVLKERFSYIPPRPQMPIIPLAIHCKDFKRSEETRSAVRNRYKFADRDVVVATVARLEVYAKFNPAPLFMALEAAQQDLRGQAQLRYLVCGLYTDAHSKSVFEKCAAELMPSVSYVHHNGEDPEAPAQALSAADIFVFPIDNYQETFGLAPIEAMASGLPVIVSDWNGMKDTVSEDVGFRIPTSTLGEHHSEPEASFLFNNPDQVAIFGNRTSAMVDINIPKMQKAICELALNPELRERMGVAGKNRAATLYDWSAVIPQYQDFWAELSSIRSSNSQEGSESVVRNPILPNPTWMFRSYPTKLHENGIEHCIAKKTKISIKQMYHILRYENMKYRPFEGSDLVQKVYSALEESGSVGASSNDIAKEINEPRTKVERALIWLSKYNYVDIS